MTCGDSELSDEDFLFTNGAALGSGKGNLLLGFGDTLCFVEAVDRWCGLGDRLGAKIRSKTSKGSKGGRRQQQQ